MQLVSQSQPLRVALIDLYDNTPNQGMRAIRELLAACDGRFYGQPITFEIFETRYLGEAPGLDFDVYLSSGGPGSPFDGEGKPWEANYFGWLDAVWAHNQRIGETKKHVFFICHSFQMMVRHFELAEVTARRSESFGIFPVHQTSAGAHDPLFADLNDPFYAADFRKWQVVQPSLSRFDELGAEVLALEKKRPHIPLERAMMAIRITPEVVGVQFHPEADPPGMGVHFRQPERRAAIIKQHGEAKYERILHRLDAPDYLKHTHDHLLPTFLRHAVEALRPELVLESAA